ncbi:hypothetical protein [Variovorax saccharolyticus]|uniref:hypothetical protein n=1 Tax=Variovorax saccharolyticus TaxID=3053516 RepID=UPI002577637A|nr:MULTISPECIES: hypothetical protein [unclassified Variovorax]MDM0022355.1 hypothetical protein [Variovorax sp. J22R187]MDM0029010.1 hypothetical protein [Variovorax sp. J31P216]
MTSEALMQRPVAAPSNRQRLFVRYFTAILIDLVVLNLFVEYSDNVTIDSFTISLLAAVLLQVLLQLTIAVENRVAAVFKARSGGLMTFLRFFFAWLVLFGSKFVILEALSFAFGDKVRFEGAFNGIVALIAVIVTMLVAEEAMVLIFRRLGGKPDGAQATHRDSRTLETSPRAVQEDPTRTGPTTVSQRV